MLAAPAAAMPRLYKRNNLKQIALDMPWHVRPSGWSAIGSSEFYRLDGIGVGEITADGSSHKTKRVSAVLNIRKYDRHGFYV